MHRVCAQPALWLMVLGLCLCRGALADDVFPRPPELEPDIHFWTRVYTEIDTAHGFIHDARHLDVVYETMDVPADARARSRSIDKRRQHYRAILLSLAGGKREHLSGEEERVLALWSDASDKELRAAADELRFQLGQADRFRAGYIRAGAWLPHIQRIFADMQLPTELGYLPHVESSFNPNAYSHAAAAGLWQFTSYTGRRFMRVDYVVDERMDPFIATVAAARLLKENYDELGTWPLALTAYNHGLNGMHHAVRTLGTTDIVRVLRNYQSKSFGFASRNFYVSFLAAVDVERNAEAYFGPLERMPEDRYATLTVDAFVPAATLAHKLGVEREALRELNPALRAPVWRGEKYVPRGFTLRIPLDGATDAAAAVAALEPSQLYTAQRPDVEHRVTRGETLSQIAAQYGVSVQAIVQANSLRSAHYIHIGQVLQLPTGAIATRDAALAQAPAVAVDGRYTVRSGDVLSKIAVRLGVDAGELARVNGVSDPRRLRVGQVLQLPQSAAAPESPAADAALVASGAQYVVRRGDTLAVIARHHGMTEAQLADLNGLSNPNRIAIGQVIKLDAPQPTRASLKLAELPEEGTPDNSAPAADPAPDAAAPPVEAAPATTPAVLPAGQSEAPAPALETALPAVTVQPLAQPLGPPPGP